MPPRSGEKPLRPQQELDWSKLLATALVMPGSVGNTYDRFYNYSFLNKVLLMLQGVEEPVATYKRWQDLGRQVLKGSKAKEIIRPIVIEKKDETGKVQDKRLLFKPVRCLFTLSETEGAELPEVALPTWSKEKALETLDIKERPFRGTLDGNVQGFSTGREYAINPVAAHPTRTLFHELGHIVLGHTVPEKHSDYIVHQGNYEFQAEATALLTLNELGELTDEHASHSRGYIQHWMKNTLPPPASIRQVFTATDTILKAGRVSEEQLELFNE